MKRQCFFLISLALLTSLQTLAEPIRHCHERADQNARAWCSDTAKRTQLKSMFGVDFALKSKIGTELGAQAGVEAGAQAVDMESARFCVRVVKVALTSAHCDKPLKFEEKVKITVDRPIAWRVKPGQRITSFIAWPFDPLDRPYFGGHLQQFHTPEAIGLILLPGTGPNAKTSIEIGYEVLGY